MAHPPPGTPSTGSADSILPCPECLAAGVASPIFAGNAERGRHRRIAHGVLGTSQTARTRREALRRGSDLGIDNKRPLFLPNMASSHEPEEEIPDLLSGFVLGHVVNFMENYARQNRVSLCKLTRKIASLLSKTCTD
jgi:hypothetical protein